MARPSGLLYSAHIKSHRDTFMSLSDRFDQALQFASRAHRDQQRKGGETPYVSHPLAVASLVLEHGGDEDQAIAGLLHDLIEDQSEQFGGPASLKIYLRERFGSRVASIVEDCTDFSINSPRPEWRARKVAYLASLPQKPTDSLLVSGCDKLHNARCILRDLRLYGDQLWPRFNGGREGSLWYYRSLADSFREGGTSNALVEELDRVVSDIERLA